MKMQGWILAIEAGRPPLQICRFHVFASWQPFPRRPQGACNNTSSNGCCICFRGQCRANVNSASHHTFSAFPLCLCFARHTYSTETPLLRVNFRPSKNDYFCMEWWGSVASILACTNRIFLPRIKGTEAISLHFVRPEHNTLIAL